MRLPIRLIEGFGARAIERAAQDVEDYVAERLSELTKDLTPNPVLEIASMPRGDYVEVKIFVGSPDAMSRIQIDADVISRELRSMGVSAAIYVRIAAGVAASP